MSYLYDPDETKTKSQIDVTCNQIWKLVYPLLKTQLCKNSASSGRKDFFHYPYKKWQVYNIVYTGVSLSVLPIPRSTYPSFRVSEPVRVLNQYS